MSIAGRTCRTCGKASELEDDSILFPLYNSANYVSELKVILEEFDIWNLNISQNDGLPQQICLTCFDSFCQVHNFRILCIETQMNFGEMCTGLDIIIKDTITDEDYDYSENVGDEFVIVQEHYKFPGDERLKSSVPTITPDLSNTKNNDLDSDEENTIKSEEPNESKEKPIPNYKEFRCEFCMEVVSFDDPDQLNDHYNQLHLTNLPYTCPKCDKCFNTKAKRNSHARIHYRIVLNCEICGKKVRGGKQMMMQHIELNHDDKDRECPTCGKEFKMISLKRFNYHQSWHDDSKLHKCKFCDKKFIQTTHLTVHERTHTGECPYKCHKCELAFKNPNLLNNHIRMHGERNIQCPECPKKFFYKHGLKLHMQIHDPNIKLPTCEICNITYRSSVNYQLHNYKKHGGPATQSILNILKKPHIKQPDIKPYKCSECPQAFVLHTQLVKHLKTHNEDRPYSCKICVKAFKRLAHLKLHMDSLHLNKKPHKCTLCGWAFPQRNNLNEHIAAKHANTRDFKCDICPKDFATIKSLRTHMLKHSEKKPFVCTVCNKRFKRLFVLKNHMNGHLRKNEADVEGGDITDIVVEEELEELSRLKS